MMNNKKINKSRDVGRWSNKLCTGTVKAMVVIVSVLSVSACGSGDSDTGSTAENAATGGSVLGSTGGTAVETSSSSSLVGTWVQCLASVGDVSTQKTYSMTDSLYTENITIFESEDCTGDGLSVDSLGIYFTEGFYEVTGSSTSEEGLSVQQVTWTINKSKGVVVPAAMQIAFYNIVYTGTINQLVFGQFGFDESNRPTKLELEAPFIRQ